MVDVTNQITRAYTYDENGQYTVLVREMICSTGTSKYPTPCGTTIMPKKRARWGYFPTWGSHAQYLTRIDSANAFHSVLYTEPDETTLSVQSFEALGTPASHGCVRVQRQANADGYSHTWLWNNLRGQKDIKIIIWDDDGRKLRETDPATPMYYNKDGGKKYHTTARCASVKSRYLPLSAITYGDLSSYPYNQLSPCTTCGAPERPEVVAAWNSVIDEAYDELGLTP